MTLEQSLSLFFFGAGGGGDDDALTIGSGSAIAMCAPSTPRALVAAYNSKMDTQYDHYRVKFCYSDVCPPHS